MKTKQPVWKLIAKLGDVNPIDYGGAFVYEDATGVYDPEVELIATEEDCERWTVYRFSIDPCTFINGILSDNKFHPELTALFADSLEAVAETYGRAASDIIHSLTSGTLQDRAQAWLNIGNYHGMENLDSYPLTFTDRAEVEARYASETANR